MPAPPDAPGLGQNLWQRCFAYPLSPPGRKHGPQGYLRYESYRDWLRDEFAFRCAYCLMRENWLRGSVGFQIDHCLPMLAAPARALDYDNLVYTCPWCNQAKAHVPVPNPTDVALGKSLQVDADGVISALNPLGQILIDGLRLNHWEITRQRQLVIQVARLADERNNLGFLQRWFAIPGDLPDLRHKRPPGGNRRPAGLLDSYFELRRRGRLHYY